MSEPKKLDALIKTTSPSLSTAIRGVEAEIIAVKDAPKQELTEEELRMIMVTVCAGCGIKELPSQPIVKLCLKVWLNKYSLRINKHEMALAFELNVRGDLESKIEHFQCFSLEYFCGVLNLYLEKRKDAVAKQKLQEDSKDAPSLIAPAADMHQFILNDIEALKVDEKDLLLSGATVAAKLEYLSTIQEIDISESAIKAYRAQAIDVVLRNTANAKVGERKFGKLMDLENKSVRIKTGKHFTEKDENEIQGELRRLIYKAELKKLLTSK